MTMSGRPEDEFFDDVEAEEARLEAEEQAEMEAAEAEEEANPSPKKERVADPNDPEQVLAILDKLKADRPNDAAPRLVINMMGVPKRPEIPAKDFAGAMGVEPEVIIPFDPQLFGNASNNGQMIAETDATAAPSVEIDRLAGLLTGRVVEVEQKSLLKKLLRK